MHLHISDEWKESVRSTIPALPDELRDKYINEYDLPVYDADILTMRKEMSDFFSDMVENHQADPKLASNWLMGSVNEYLNKNNAELEDTGLTAENLTGMINIIEDGTISSKQAKKVFSVLVEKGGTAKQVAKDLGMEQISDPAVLTGMVTDCLLYTSDAADE